MKGVRLIIPHGSDINIIRDKLSSELVIKCEWKVFDGKVYFGWIGGTSFLLYLDGYSVDSIEKNMIGIEMSDEEWDYLRLRVI